MLYGCLIFKYFWVIQRATTYICSVARVDGFEYVDKISNLNYGRKTIKAMKNRCRKHHKKAKPLKVKSLRAMSSRTGAAIPLNGIIQ